MKDLPCDTCLKYAICINKAELQCYDLVDWLLKYDAKSSYRVNRICKFEKFWNKDLSIIGSNDGNIRFKKGGIAIHV